MAATLDRLKNAFASLARGGDAHALYRNLYRAQVVKQHGSLKRVDVKTDDPRLPPLSNIPLRVGVPGLDVVLPPGGFVLVGWEDGRPDRPFATTWWPGDTAGGTKPERLTFAAGQVELGGAATEQLIQGTSFVGDFVALIKAQETFNENVVAALLSLGQTVVPAEIKAAVLQMSLRNYLSQVSRTQ